MWYDWIPLSIYYFLPAYVANMTPVLVKRLPWDTPIQKKLFGAHKTWRGLLLGTLAGFLIFAIQKFAYSSGFTRFAFLEYTHTPWAYGVLLAAGALLGDLVKSYYKRKQALPPGTPWFPWDQLDFVFGGILAASILYTPPIEIALTLVILSPLLHLAINYLGHLLKLKSNKW